jgi:hypothetical protein
VRLDDLELERRRQVGEEQDPGAEGDRVHDEPVLVDDAGSRERGPPWAIGSPRPARTLSRISANAEVRLTTAGIQRYG